MDLVNLCLRFFKTRDIYKILKIERLASAKDIERAYYLLCLQLHPDHFDDDAAKKLATEKFQLVSNIYKKILCVKKAKKQYDSSGKLNAVFTRMEIPKTFLKLLKESCRVLQFDDIKPFYDFLYNSSSETASFLKNLIVTYQSFTDTKAKPIEENEIEFCEMKPMETRTKIETNGTSNKVCKGKLVSYRKHLQSTNKKLKNLLNLCEGNANVIRTTTVPRNPNKLHSYERAIFDTNISSSSSMFGQKRVYSNPLLCDLNQMKSESSFKRKHTKKSNKSFDYRTYFTKDRMRQLQEQMRVPDELCKRKILWQTSSMSNGSSSSVSCHSSPINCYNFNFINPMKNSNKQKPGLSPGLLNVEHKSGRIHGIDKSLETIKQQQCSKKPTVKKSPTKKKTKLKTPFKEDSLKSLVRLMIANKHNNDRSCLKKDDDFQKHQNPNGLNRFQGSSPNSLI